MGERPEVASCKKILEFRCGSWDAAGHFVAADAGEDCTVSLGGHAGRELTAGFGRTTAARAGSRREMVAVEFEIERFLFAKVDVGAGAAAFLFYFGEVGSLVRIGV